MNMRLVFKDLPSGGLQAAFPWSSRLVFILIGLVLVAAAFLPAGEAQNSSPLALTAIAILFLASCYEERWRFDSANEKLSFRFGLIFLAKKFDVPFSAVDSVRLERFVKGGRAAPQDRGEPTSFKRFLTPKRYLRLSISLKDGQTLVVETQPMEKADRLRSAGRRLAAIMTLEEPTETDA